MSSPRYVEMMDGGASQAPNRKSFPGHEMANLIKSPYLSMALTIAAMITGKISFDPLFSANCWTLRILTPVSVASDQLLCLPEPFTPCEVRIRN